MAGTLFQRSGYIRNGIFVVCLNFDVGVRTQSEAQFGIGVINNGTERRHNVCITGI